ncbi:hypothetical protein [Nocardia sp. NPDC052566]|uniref:hypothetical protein n=1 Tax=Nocardia sp. NPDC052566 TaxID=3364330 RepID=UPI0037C95743
MHWDQMAATPEDLRERVTRLRRGAGQQEILESIVGAADGPWLGTLDVDARGTAELKMHLAGQYRLIAVVTGAGKLDLAQMKSPGTEQVLSSKPSLRRGWEAPAKPPKPPEWLGYVVDWIGKANAEVDRRAFVEWLLIGADRKLATATDTIHTLRADLMEREMARAELAAEVAALRAELEYLAEPD